MKTLVNMCVCECSSQSMLFLNMIGIKVSKGAKIRNRYNQVPHLTRDTNGKVTNSQLDTTNESQEVSPFPAGDHKAHINRQSHTIHKGLLIKDLFKIVYRLDIHHKRFNFTSLHVFVSHVQFFVIEG